MSPDSPLIGFTIALKNTGGGTEAITMSNAYGLEMSLSDSFPVRILMMAPPHLMEPITGSTEVLKRGVIAGASYTPGDGDYDKIIKGGGTWVLAREGDRLDDILGAGLGVLFCLRSLMDDDVEAMTQILQKAAKDHSVGRDNLMIGFDVSHDGGVKGVESRIDKIVSALSDCGLPDFPLLINGYLKDGSLDAYRDLPGIDGFLFQDCAFHDVLTVVDKLYPT